MLGDQVGQAFLEMLQAIEEDSSESLKSYGRWFEALANRNQGWQDYLLDRLLATDNSFARQVQHRSLAHLPPALIQAVKRDLRSLQMLYSCNSNQVCKWVNKQVKLSEELIPWADNLEPKSSLKKASFPIKNRLKSLKNWADALGDLADYYRQFGTGIFAEYRAFRWQHEKLVAVAHPDPVQMADLVGYESQQEMILKNTEFLLSGNSALHILLYGSRGSGKSSLVKSLLHKFGDRNLRLIEVAKSELKHLSTIAEQVRDLPQKFVIFVDDLSFEEDDDAYKALKVVLEGNLTARPQNVVVYATSNRRHLIREFFDDRPRPKDADEVHTWDTVQEKLSFSDRFGLTLTFEPPDQAAYLKMIRHLAEQANIALPSEALEHQALQWATRHNGRSGRTARQFVDFLHSDLAVFGSS
ncbi:MAG: ATP-binding protein [Leptolyngbyaceae cyanobacterium CSU_1_3]|nr:ATP-binding protein [Leptolyngbyaceae cyanobacterium CSU_1_3]